MATMELGIGLQKTWNRTISGLDEFNRKMAKGKGLVPRNCRLEALPDDQHGEWLEYTPYMGFKPEIMTLKGLPQTYDLVLQLCKVSIEDLFSQHEVTRGTNKSDIRSGDMVGMLLEQDAYGMLPAHAVFEESLEAVMQRVLQRMQVGYTEERSIKISGADGGWKVSKFKGADLRNNTDIHVKTHSSLPDSRVARQAAILERFTQGFYGNPQDPKVLRHVQRLAGDAVTTENIYEEIRYDETNASIENDILKTGKVMPENLPPNDYDNHGVHLEEHNRFRKTREFQELKEKDPDVFMIADAAIRQHVSIHQKYVQEAMEAQMKQAMAMEGKLNQR
jgi:hypothetical protein